MVKEIAVPVGGAARATLMREDLHETDDAEVTVALTLGDDGTINLGVESETALVGQNLSALETITDGGDGPAGHADPATDQFVSAQDVADELGVDKTTVTRRIKSNRLIGYQGFKRDWLIPRAQFRSGDVVPGIAETIALFGNDHRNAWFFLSSRFFYGDDDPRPIDRLRTLKRGDKAALEACISEFEAVKDSLDHGDHF